MKNDFFDTIINQKLSGHRCPVPVDAWDNIVNRKKKKRYALYWWFFSVLLLTGTGIFCWCLKPNVTGDLLAKEKRENKNGIVSQVRQLNTANTRGNTVENKKAGNSKTENDPGENALRIVKPDATISTSYNSKALGKKEQQGIYSEEKKLELKESNYSFEKDTVSVTIRKTKNAEPAQKTKLFSAKRQEEENNGTSNAEAERGNSTAKKKLNGAVKGPYYELANWKVLIPKDSLFTSTTDRLQLHRPVIVMPGMNKEGTITTAAKKKNKKLMIDLSVTPGLPLQVNARLLSIQRTIATNEAKAAYKADNIQTSLQTNLAYTIAFRKKIAKKLAIGTGLQYSTIKETTRLSGEEINTTYSVVQRLIYVNALPILVDDTIATSTSGLRIIRAMNSYDFISIPLSIHYIVTENSRWTFSVSGGLYFTIKANYKNSITGDLSPQYATVFKTGGNKNKVNTDIHAGFRLSRNIGKRYKLYVEPEIRYNTGKYVLTDMVNYKSIHRAGFSVGFSYELSY